MVALPALFGSPSWVVPSAEGKCHRRASLKSFESDRYKNVVLITFTFRFERRRKSSFLSPLSL